MFPLWPFLLLQTPAAETPNQFEILQRVKLNVEAQLALVSNYTCVETIERDYYLEPRACFADISRNKPKEYMRDRLRLDVAVSRGNEIFSWHGENQFTSSNISAVIPNGPSTSGQFVGFLRNIFLTPGVQFKFNGSSTSNGVAVYTFDYTVQLLRSEYYLKGIREASVVPYHGSLTVDAETFELTHLDIVADQIPMGSGMCSAETQIDYQLVNISGHQSLLPSSFVLALKNHPDIYTVNHNQYTECREFRGESTLHFTMADPGATVATRQAIEEPLPPGLTLRASVDNAISDRDSYIGDAVVGTLAEPLKIPGRNKIIPKGAVLHGVISQMEQHSEGPDYWLFGIKFERLTSGEDTYLLNAWPLPSAYRDISSRVNREQAEAAQQGYWFIDGSHFKLSKHFTRYWRTKKVSKQPGDNM